MPSRDLAAFVAAVETRTIQGAADALMLTQSAATKRIQALERRLGVQLLQRSTHGVSPTRAGRLAYPEAKEALAALARIEHGLRASGSQGPRLALAASVTIGGYLLPRWLADFRPTAPDVLAQVEVLNSASVLNRVQERGAEIGFVDSLDDLAEYDHLPLELDEIVVVVAAGHPWATKSVLDPRALAGEPFYAREEGSGTLAVADQRLAQRGIHLCPCLQMAGTQSLKRAVLQGGFTLLSHRAVEDELAARRLVALRLEGVNLHRQLYAVRRRGARPAHAAERLWRWLAGHIARPVSGGPVRASGREPREAGLPRRLVPSP